MDESLVSYIPENGDEDISSIDALLMSKNHDDQENGVPYARLEDVDEFRHRLPFAPSWKDRCCFPFKSLIMYLASQSSFR